MIPAEGNLPRSPRQDWRGGVVLGLLAGGGILLINLVLPDPTLPPPLAAEQALEPQERSPQERSTTAPDPRTSPARSGPESLPPLPPLDPEQADAQPHPF